MKTRLFTVVAALSLLACNSSQGPERTTPAEFGEVSFSPAVIRADADVTVEVSVTSRYGFSRVDIVYWLDDDESDVRAVSPYPFPTAPTAAEASLSYSGKIPGQKAGRKVTFRVRAITFYNVPSYSQPREYTVPAAGEEQPEQPNLTKK